MNLVPENINEAIKHLTPKSDEEITAGLEKDLKDIVTPYRNPEENYKILQKLRDYLVEYIDEDPTTTYPSPSKTHKILGALLYNLDKDALKEAVRKTMNDYMFG